MLSVGLFALLLAAPAPAPTELVIPEGTILTVVLNETLNTAKIQENDPVLFSLAEDICTAGHRGPVLIPRGSNVVGRIVMTERAGHFIDRAHMEIRLQEIITPSGEVYDGLSTKIVDVAKKKGNKAEVKADGGLQGPVHRQRDAFLLLFPPTTIFQLMAIPKRGPDIVLPVESHLQVKLMNPIYVEVEAPKVAQLPVQPAPQPIPVPQTVVPQAIPSVIPAVASSNPVDLLVAPVALYPDAILRDLLVASSHPLDLVQANQWVHQRRDVAGNLPASGYNDSWDPSVKAMTAYPDLLQRLSSNLDWTSKLGSTFIAQPTEVLSAVQQMRGQAKNLKSPTDSGVTVLVSTHQ